MLEEIEERENAAQVRVTTKQDALARLDADAAISKLAEELGKLQRQVSTLRVVCAMPLAAVLSS